MRFLLLLSFLLTSITSFPQIKTWFDLFTTNQVNHLAATQTSIFAAAKNALLIYTPSTGLVERLSAQGQLSDTSISALYANQQMAIIGYSTGSIDIIQNNKVIPITTIKNNYTLTNSQKKINAFYQYGQYLWLATNFGITTINLDNLSFDKTIYFRDSTDNLIAVKDLIIKDNQIFTLTDKGIYYSNIDYPGPFAQWHHISISNGLQLGLLNNSIIVLTYLGNTCALFRMQDSSFYQITYEPGFYRMKIINNKIYLLGKKIIELDANGTTIQTFTHYQTGQRIYANDILEFKGSIYVADRFLSLVKDFGQQIKTSSIFSDKVNTIKTAGQYVYILHKTDELDREYGYNAVISIIDQKGNTQFFASPVVNQFLAMAIDPNDDKHWFVASDSIGLVEIKDNQIINIYNSQNSPLTAANNNIKISYLKFDHQGRLWILYNSTTYPVLILNPDGTWQPLEASSIGVGKTFSRFILTSQDFLYAPVKEAGMMAINLQTGDARVFYPSRRIGKRINDIVEDKDGVIWFATNDGLGYLTAQDFTASGFKAIRPLVQVTLNDTTIYSYLLDNANCTRLIVDDGNRKWVGTGFFGALLLSPDCLSEIAHFNVNNHTIVTDEIYDIAYNSTTGIVYFVTDQGIIAYRNDSSHSMDDFSNVKVFPNPVRPYYSGPITITGLENNTIIKITDLRGNLVYETRSNGGTAVWNGLSISGAKPASGVYLIICTDEQGRDKCVKKLLIIR